MQGVTPWCFMSTLNTEDDSAHNCFVVNQALLRKALLLKDRMWVPSTRHLPSIGVSPRCPSLLFPATSTAGVLTRGIIAVPGTCHCEATRLSHSAPIRLSDQCLALLAASFAHITLCSIFFFFLRWGSRSSPG